MRLYMGTHSFLLKRPDVRNLENTPPHLGIHIPVDDWALEMRGCFSGQTRVIYVRDRDGKLRCYRKATGTATQDFTGPEATRVVIPELPSAINNGMPVFRSPADEWGQFTHLFAGRSGEIFGIRNEEFGGRIYKFSTLCGVAGVEVAASLYGLPISDCGWQIIPIEGYAWPLSQAPGGQSQFCVSTLVPGSCTVSFAKLSGLPLRPRTVERGYHATAVSSPLASPAFSGTFQSASTASWSEGCGWNAAFQISIPTEWSSGYYAARCTSRTGYIYDIPFIVKPAADAVLAGTHRNDIAVIANVTTWNTYNVWGGKSNYNNSDGVTKRGFSYLRPNHHLLTAFEDHGWGSHLLRGELWVFDWLQRTYGSARVHLYSDLDLHAGSFLDSYKCVVIHTHPEYFSDEMIDKLKDYLQAGGKILYLGGNSMYRLTTIDGTFTGALNDTACATTSQTSDNANVTDRSLLGISIGTLSMIGNTLKGHPFGIVEPTHDFFTTPYPVTGTEFASSSWNNAFDVSGGAGIESEWARGTATNIRVLARTNIPNYFADMVYYTPPNTTGWTLGIGSVCIGGALQSDANTQAIIKNVLHAAGVAPT